MTYAAVVVSFNRRELLRECLKALHEQTVRLDEIIVVENGSSDGSADMVREEFSGVTLFETGKNLGGAGGFAWGIQLALEAGHSWVWLMDDDARPELDALAPLVAAVELAPDLAYVASMPVIERDVVNANNAPVFSSDAGSQVRASELGGVAITTATFVGVLVNLDVASRTYLPIADFFIWGDDLEYTRRLASRGLAIVFPKSQINHPFKPSTQLGSRIYYLVRNQIWQRRLPSRRPEMWAGLTVTLFRIMFEQLKLADRKFPVVWGFVRGAIRGLFTNPRLVEPGRMLRAS